MSTNGNNTRPDSADGAVAGAKRRQSEGADGAAGTRAKRNRYISIACNECKRRKIKCNGQVPCQRCGNLALECLYAPNCCSNNFRDSEEFKHMNTQMTSLQEQVDTLFANVNNIQHRDASISTIGSDPNYLLKPSRSMPQAAISAGSPSQVRQKVPRFQGPTSAAYSFDVANSSLQTMGIHPPTEAAIDDPVVTKESTHSASSGSLSPLAHPSKDPLWLLSKEEAMRLARVYEEEIGAMYPFLDIEKTIRHASALYSFITAATRTGLTRVDHPGADSLGDDDTNILKMVLATALMTEGSGQSSLGSRLFDSVRRLIESRFWSPQVDKRGLILLALISMYHFHQDEEALAWRIIGLAARMCLELGLHRRETLLRNFEGEEERSQATTLFWSIYVLDRRWSFGTGMPFALQDADIDPALPEPDTSTPYLKAMVAYSRLGSKVWKSVAGFDNTPNDVKHSDIGYLDYQILQWYKMIPDELQLLNPENNVDGSESRSMRRLRVLLYLRANQMRILIYRPVLHSTTSILENLSRAQTVINLAKNSIRVLTTLNQTTDIYRKQQVCFNYFLVSALAVLFLAVSHAPAQFSSLCRDEFYMALDLVKGFSIKSYASRRLWRTISGLKEVGPKLGLLSRGSSGDDAHSSAAAAMAGLATGHQVDTPTNIAMFHAAAAAAAAAATATDNPHGPSGFQMSSELTNLFEAAGGFGSVMGGSTAGSSDVNGYPTSPPGSMQGQGGGAQSGDVQTLFGNEEELSRVMKVLF
ncbi:MAG: hypothetical protein M1839_004415 [Geoglossum umbratile]|nr:MAG: hypothetical protein M1839_004415 [Geoglossum umbratile]